MNACGKYCYFTASAAHRAAQAVRRRRRQRVYRCAACTRHHGGRIVWHLTSDLRATDDHSRPPTRRRAWEIEDRAGE